MRGTTLLPCVIWLITGVYTTSIGNNEISKNNTFSENNTDINTVNSDNSTNKTTSNGGVTLNNVTGHLKLNETSRYPPNSNMGIPQSTILFPSLNSSRYTVPPQPYKNVYPLYPRRNELHPMVTILTPNSNFNYDVRPELYWYTNPAYQSLINQQKSGKPLSFIPGQPSQIYSSSHSKQSSGNPLKWDEYWKNVASNTKSRDSVGNYRPVPKQQEQLQPVQPGSRASGKQSSSLPNSPTVSPTSAQPILNYNLKPINQRSLCPTSYHFSCGSPKIELLKNYQL